MRSWLFGVFVLFALAAAAAPAGAAWVGFESDSPARPVIDATGTGRSVTVDLEVPGYHMETVDIDGQEHVRLSLPGHVWHMEPGLPELPYLAWSVTVAGEGTPVVRVLESEWEELAVAPPIPSRGHLSRDVDPASIPYSHDAFYRGTGTYPETVAVAGEPFVMRDLRGVPLRVDACRWNAETGTLSVLRHMRLEVITEGIGGVNMKSEKTSRVDAQFDRLYRGLFANYGSEKYTAIDVAGPMLIVADDALASAVEPFVTWKQQKGQPVELVTTSSVGGTTSGIQSAVTTRYESASGLTYLVLVGDVAEVPTNSGTYEGADDDTRYAMVDGSDLYPDFFVSRISATDASAVTAQVDKFVRYERDPDLGTEGAWYHMAAGLASSEGTPPDYDRAELLRQELLGYTFTSVDEIYQPDGDATDITAALEEGRSIINYIGHGSGTSWSNPYFSTTDIHALENGWTQPWIVDVSCSNGDFSLSECFAEAWLRATGSDGEPNGGLASYSASTSASWVPPCEMQTEVIDLLVTESANVLGALYYSGGMAVLDLYPGTSTEGHKLIEQYNIFGDCSLMVRTDVPTEYAPSHLAVAYLGVGTYDVADLPEGALACLWRDGVIYGTATADAAGLAQIVLDEAITTVGDMTLTVTGYNLDTYQATLPVIAPSTATIDPTSVDVLTATDVTVTVMGSDGVTPLAGIDVWVEGLGYATTPVATDTSGEAVISVTAPYGPSLQVIGRDPAETYDLFSETLTVVASALSSPDLAVSTDIGLSDSFAVGWPGTLQATVTETGHTLYLTLPDGTESSTGGLTLVGTPATAGEATGVIAVEGYDLYSETFPVIEATGTLAGTVVDGAASALSGVEMNVYASGTSTLVATATSGVDGTYALADPLAVGDYDLEAVLFGYEPCTVAIFVAYGANTEDVVLTAAPAGDLSGTITETGTGDPLDAVISLYRPDTGDLYAQTSTDPLDGSYLLSGLTYFTYDVRVTADQHMPVTTSVPILSSASVLDVALDPTQGNILVIDDTTSKATATPDKYDDKGNLISRGGPVISRDATQLVTDLETLGYSVTLEALSATDPETWWSYDLLLATSGDNTTSLNDATIRDELVAYAQGGGRVLVEGGEVAYDHASSDADFAADVLHIGSWHADSAGEVSVADATHPVMSLPNVISSTLDLDYSGYGDSDAVDAASDATMIGNWTNYTGYASVVAYDDTPSAVSGQTVYFAFNWYALDTTDAADLLQNAVSWLLAVEEAGTASVSGTVTLQHQSDHAGIEVQIQPGGDTVTTGTDGSYEFTDLYAADYTITATMDGWSAAGVAITLGEGETLTGQDLVLTGIVETSECSAPAVSIPDYDTTGISDVINMPFPNGETVTSVEVFVDITHTYQGDLAVSLTSPDGVTVVLHNRSGGSSDDIYGWYPTELTPVGDLDDFVGGTLGGDWTLTVSDNAGSDTGTLNEWCLHVEYGGGLTPIGDTPGRVALGQNFPNPFNPSTSIHFALPEAAHVSLAVYDLAGRRVRTLVQGDLPAADHVVVWDGRGEAGRRVASGAYYYRLNVGGEVLTRKMTLVK